MKVEVRAINRSLVAAAFAASLLSAASSALAGPETPDPHHLFALARAATGGDAWGSLEAVRSHGTLTIGGSGSPFEQIIEHRLGYSRNTVGTGATASVSGYNGITWTAAGGLVYTVDLPGLQADSVSQAFIARDGWWNADDSASMRWLRAEGAASNMSDVVEVIPAGGNPVQVWIDKLSHRITKTVILADLGPLSTTYADWRPVGGVQLPFEQTTSDATGASAVLKLDSALPDRSPGVEAFAPPAAASQGRLSGDPIASVPFQFDGFDRGHIVVRARVEGKPLTLLFDTGGANYLTPETAAKLGLKPTGGIAVGGVGEGSVTGGLAGVREIALEGASLHDQSALVAPLPFAAVHPRSGLHVAGLVGAEFFWTFRTQIDYIGRKLRFSDPRASVPIRGRVLPFFNDGHTVFVEATIDGVSGLFGVDTGDPGGVTVFRQFADAHGLFKTGGSASVSSGGVGGRLAQQEFRARSFMLAGQHLPRPLVTVTDTKAGAYASKTLAGFLGAQVLSRFTMTFDPLRHTLSLEPNAKLRAPYPQDRTGFSLSQEKPDEMEVLSVKPDSPAARAGLRAGDLIVAVNGRSVRRQQLGLYDLLPLRFGHSSFTLTVRGKDRLRQVRIVPREIA